MNKMRKILALLLAMTMVLALATTAYADGEKWTEETTDDGWVKVINEGGKTLGYSPDSGVAIVEDDGFAFKDLNRNGELDPYEDWRLDNETRARDLTNLLSVEEMIPLFTHGGWMSFGSEIEGTDLEYIENGGRGGVTRSAANTGSTSMAVTWTNALQALCEATGNWGIPATVSVDPCNISNTIDQLALGATFDVDTAFALGVAHGKMYRSVGITMLLGPQIDIGTTPVLARTAGTYTEDPALSRDLADAYISGLQSTWAEDGTDLGWGVDSVYAITKHYVGAGAAEGGRNDHSDSGKFDVFPGDNFAAHLIPFFDGAFNLTKSITHESGVMPNYAISYERNHKLGEWVGGAYSEYKIGLLRENNYQGFILTDWQITVDGAEPFGVEDLTVSERFAKLYMNGIHQVGGTSDLDAAADGFELVQDELGENEALEILRNAAYHFLLTQFQCGLYENPYVELETAQAVNYNSDTEEFSLAMQEKSVIMLKNNGDTVHQAGEEEEMLTVYVPWKFSAATEGNSSAAGNPASWEPAMDLEVVEEYYNVVTDTLGEPSGEPDEEGNPTYTENDIIRASAEELATCDLALVPMTAPATDSKVDGTDEYLSDDPYLPASIQYDKYKAKKARTESIAADQKTITKNDGYGMVSETVDINRSYAKKTAARASNYSDLEMLQNVKASVPETCKVVVLMEAGRPMVWSEVEPSADVILLSYSGAGFNGEWFYTEALLNILSGQVEPSGLLNYQQPASMDAVEKQKEDVPRDCECYKDANGNEYDFGFGLNWSGVIDDVRTQTYKVDPLTTPTSIEFHKAETVKNTVQTQPAETEEPVADSGTVPAAPDAGTTEGTPDNSPTDGETQTAEPEATEPAEPEAEPEAAEPAEAEAEPDEVETEAKGSKLVDTLMTVLAPIFNKMGAETSQVKPYLEKCAPYITALLIAVGLLIVLLIAAHWMAKKGSRHVIRWTAVLAFLLALVMIVNLICYGPMKSIVSGVLNASKAEISEDVVEGSRSVIQQVGEEGMVLVKNSDNLLPLAAETTKLNVFGWASVHPVFSGTGSAASGEQGKPVDILESLSMAGFSTNEELSKLYANYWSSADFYGGNRPSIGMQEQDWTLPEPTTEYYTETLLNNAKDFSDTAVIVFARSGGENADLPSDMHAVINGTFDVSKSGRVQETVATNYTYTGAKFYNNCIDPNCPRTYDEFAEGEHYLQLSQTERDLGETVTANFDKVIVVINANNAMELGWIEAYPQIRSVILAPGTGASGMIALGEILNGSVNPSGRTADTYLYDLRSAPTWNHSGNSGNHFYENADKATNVDDLTKQLAREDASFNGVVSFLDYVEGIYMGYKFYETAAEEGLIDFESTVQFPFGYGLSYTTFEQKITNLQKDDVNVTVTVEVKNTGSVAGKDVVELYYTPPYTNGGIEKASVNLIDFGKTGLLKPGESETITLTVALENMASYDSSCIKTANGGYVLEAGEYVMSVRSDSHTVLDSKNFTLDADIDYSINGRASDQETAVNRFGYMESDHEILSRKDHFANYEKAVAEPEAEEYKLSKDDTKAIQAITVVKYKPEKHDDPNDVMPTIGAKNGLTLTNLAGKSYDDPDWEKLLDQLSIDDMVSLINVGGWQTVEVKSVGKVATSDCDGPSGLSNYVTGSNGTQFPTEVLMAQTWNKELARSIGAAMGQEFADANNFGWYGPAMNLHRSAFSGRNFEYYSEDAVLSGLFASEEVNGAAKLGVYPYIKHFAANDQETNRLAFLTTWMTEQCFRENCLKPFEIVVKNFDFDHYAMGVMTAYNWLGLVPVISSPELLKDVLRGEWGFQGVVISDYNGGYGYQITDAAIRAGNDLMLGYGVATGTALKDTAAATCVLAMRQACKNILYTVGNSGYYAEAAAAAHEARDQAAAAAAQNTGMSKMDKLFLGLDIGTGIVVLGLEALVLLRWLKKRKASAK